MKRLKECHVLVTPTSFGQEDMRLILRLEAQEFATAVQQARSG
jgi:hypothetical protein